MENSDFGKKLIRCRNLRGLTQEEVAEKCNVTTRTIQRIESGVVKPRAATIKLISNSLGIDFFETSNSSYGGSKENQATKFEGHTFLWYLVDLFNLKTNAMKKISILSVSTLLIVFLFVSIFNVKAQNGIKNQESLVIQRNGDNTLKRVEAVFTNHLTLDSLVQMKKELQNLGITINYKRIEFDVHNLLSRLDCQVISNDGFSGSFGTGDLKERKRGEKIGFYRDYTANSESPFGTGLLE